MTVAAALRELWSRRVAVAAGVALATIAAVLVAFRVEPGLPPSFESRQYDVGVASAGVLVDSPSSLAIDLSGGQSKADVEAVSARARLLASLMATSPLKDRIARRAGVPSRRMLASAPTEASSAVRAPVATGAATVKPTDPGASILTVYVNELLPIITADAQAPTPQTARRISSAAVQELSAYLQTVAASDQVPDARQLVIKPLGPPQAAVDRRGPRRLLSLLAFVFVLGGWCAGILVVVALARSWHAVGAAEQVPNLPATAAVEEPERMAAPPEQAVRQGSMPSPARRFHGAARDADDVLGQPERPIRVA